METVIIQKLIGPSKEVCNEWGMYFRKVDKEGNDITTYPNGVIMSILFAFVFAAPYYDKELTQNEQTT